MDVYELKKPVEKKNTVSPMEHTSIFADSYRDFVRIVRTVLLLASVVLSIFVIVSVLSGGSYTPLYFLPLGLWFMSRMMDDDNEDNDD